MEIVPPCSEIYILHQIVHIHLEKWQTTASSNLSKLVCCGNTCPKCEQCCDWEYRGDGIYYGRGDRGPNFGDYVKIASATCTYYGADPLGFNNRGNSIKCDGYLYHGIDCICTCPR